MIKLKRVPQIVPHKKKFRYENYSSLANLSDNKSTLQNKNENIFMGKCDLKQNC